MLNSRMPQLTFEQIPSNKASSLKNFGNYFPNGFDELKYSTERICNPSVRHKSHNTRVSVRIRTTESLVVQWLKGGF